MIDLTPIDERIQRKLFEKMKVLGREHPAPPNQPAKGGDTLIHAKMATRSTFLRMTSGLESPVILMGGELTSDSTDFEGNMTLLGNTGRLAAGYDEIYGPRSYYGEDDFFEENDLGQNKHKRPMPGLKSIDVQFKGGVRALREGTISWTCWGFEDLNRMMPHFLSHGTTVMLEWGWVYDKNTLQNLPTMLDENGIKRSAYKDYINVVREGNGDFDFMVGIIKNFEFTTRDDGGFDCQTIITSVGASIIDNIQPNKKQVNLDTPYYNIKKTEGIREIREKISAALNSTTEKNADALITHDVGVTMKSFIANIDSYIWTEIQSQLPISQPSRGSFLTNMMPPTIQSDIIPEEKPENDTTLHWKKYQWILEYQPQEDIPKEGLTGFIAKKIGLIQQPEIRNVWVRWGWFEDNILSKFLTLVSDSKNNPIVTEFRSVEKLGNTDSYESVRIKNHPKFETTDLNKYILPGQFSTFEPPAEWKKQEPKIKGDSAKWQKLEQIVSQDFKPFAVDLALVVSPVAEEYTGTLKQNTSLFKSNPEVRGKPKAVRKQVWMENMTPQSIKLDKSEGYLRNMLINTKVLKDAVGLDDEGTWTTEAINVREFLESLLSLLNQDINFWNFEIIQDQIETNRSKIIDTQITKFDFQSKTAINSTEEKSKSTKSVYEPTTNTIWNNGVFFFPVWQSDSIVKRQNITAKIPDAMALSIMYGANFDTIKSLGNLPQESTDIEASALAGAFNYYKEGNPDSSLDNIEIALKKEGFETLGALEIEDTQLKLDKKGGTDNVIAFLNKPAVRLALKKTYQEKVDNINEQIGAAADAKIDAELGKLVDPSIPVPLPNEILRDPDLRPKFISLVQDDIDYGIGGGNRYTELYSSKYHKTGRMREFFISTINTYTSFTGIEISSQGRDTAKPLLIPLDIELDIDGIGGIIPGNSFHSTYLPTRYQEESVFQIFDVNHKLDESNWTVTLSGKMRSTFNKLTKTKTKLVELEEVMDRLIKAKEAAQKLNIRDFEDQFGVSHGTFEQGDTLIQMRLKRNYEALGLDKFGKKKKAPMT